MFRCPLDIYGEQQRNVDEINCAKVSKVMQNIFFVFKIN